MIKEKHYHHRRGITILVIHILFLVSSPSIWGQDDDINQLNKVWDSIRSTYLSEGLKNDNVVQTLTRINSTIVSKMAAIMAQISPTEKEIEEGKLLIDIYEYILSDLINSDEETFLSVNNLLNGYILSAYNTSFDSYYGRDLSFSFLIPKIDLYSKRAFFKACLSIYDNDLVGFEDNLALFRGSLEYNKNAYTDINELFHCYISAVNTLAMFLHWSGQSNLAMLLLYSVLNNETNIPYDDSPCDIITKQLQEETRTKLCYISTEIGENERLYVLANPLSVTNHYSINELLQQRTMLFQAFWWDDAIKALAKDTESLLEHGLNGDMGAGIWRSACYAALSKLYRVNDELSNAKKCITKSLAIDSDHFSFDHQFESSNVYYATKDYVAAKSKCLECIGYINTHTGPVTRYLDDLYLLLCQIAINQNDYSNIVEYTSAFCSHFQRTFIDETLYLVPSQIENYWWNTSDVGVDLSILAEVTQNEPAAAESLYDVLLFHKNLTVRMSNAFRNNIEESGDSLLINKYNQYLRLLREKESTDERLQITEKELAILYSKHNEFNNSFALSWRDVQKKLKKREVAIEFVSYFEGEINPVQCYAAVVIQPGYAFPHFIKLCTGLQLKDLWGATSNGNYPPFYEDDLLDKASDLIWGKLAKELIGIKRVYYAPHTGLSQINLDILLQKSGGERMVDKYAMFRLSSTGELCNSDREECSKSMSLIGAAHYGITQSNQPGVEVIRGLKKEIGWDELVGAKDEIISISNIIPQHWQSQVLIGDEATEVAFQSMSGTSPHILHVATHGFYLSDHKARQWPYYKKYEEEHIPESQRVGLVFANANDSWLFSGKQGPHDGTLTAAEIMGLDLSNTDILTLSSCQSGVGEWYIDGSYGLQRAFKVAGCKTIIMSLWPISDSLTRTFMDVFYHSLFKGDERHEAFKKAQKKVRAIDPSPETWGAFIMLD